MLSRVSWLESISGTTYRQFGPILKNRTRIKSNRGREIIMTEKLTPKETIRAFCTQCLGMKQFNHEVILHCQGDKSMVGPCMFYPYRIGKRPPIRVFREFCLDCMCRSIGSVRDCTVEDCECYPYRSGKNPALRGKRKASKEGIAALKKNRDPPRDDTKSDLKSIFYLQPRGRHGTGKDSLNFSQN